MCKLCASAVLLLAFFAFTDAYFLSVFANKKQDPPQMPVQNGWGRSPPSQPPQTSYKDYYMGPMQMQQMPMASMHQFSYEPASVIMSPYRQQMQYMEPQFHNVKLVPCMCPLTQDLIDQHTQSMNMNYPAPTSQPSTDSTKLAPVSNNPTSS